MARTGRRPGNSDTREAILQAARDAFAERGFDGASIRAIATSAGVDPALVHHYFGTKDQLFIAAIEMPFDPGTAVPFITSGDLDHIGERIIRTAITVWDSPVGGTAAALVRSAVQQDWTARLLREFVTTQIMRRIITTLDIDPDEARVRASLVVSQVLGLIVSRYIIKVPPLSTAPVEALVATIGPTVQRYITGPLPQPPETFLSGAPRAQ